MLVPALSFSFGDEFKSDVSGLDGGDILLPGLVATGKTARKKIRSVTILKVQCKIIMKDKGRLLDDLDLFS